MSAVRLAAFALGLAGVAVPSAACINTFESEIRRYQSIGDDAGVAGEIAKLEAGYRKDRSLEHTNDLAVARLLTRRNADAIELLNEAEKRFPGRAIVAANLGTAYELSGKDAEALRWIREGVSRDPKEHFGSEWLHVKILEAKLELAKDPDWLETHTVLGISFGKEELPVMPKSLPLNEKGAERAPKDIGEAIWYQLQERTKFVRPPDAIVADLYAAYGDLVYASATPSNYDLYLGDPGALYSSALRYGPANASRTELRKRMFEAAYPADTWVSQFKEFEVR